MDIRWLDISDNSPVGVINPVFKNSQTLTQTASGSVGMTMTEGRSAGNGCFYYEITKTAGTTGNNRTGLVNDNNTSFNYSSNIYHSSQGTNIPTGTTIGVLMDLRNPLSPKAKYTRDGVTWGNWVTIAGNNGTALYGTYYIAINNSASGSSSTYTANVGDTPFVHELRMEDLIDLSVIYSFNGTRVLEIISKSLIHNNGNYMSYSYKLNSRTRNENNIVLSNEFTLNSSGNYNTTRIPSKAFDGQIRGYEDSWASTNIQNSYLGLVFKEAQIVNRIKLYAPSDMSTSGEKLMVKDFMFQGSNDGTNWTTLTIVNNQVDWIDGEGREYEFENQTPYLRYRILNFGYNRASKIVYVSELELYSDTLEYVAQWKSLGSQTPSIGDFKTEGMDYLKPLLSRKNTDSKINMTSDSSVTLEGKLYSVILDLKNYPHLETIKGGN